MLYNLGPSTSANPRFVPYATWAANLGVPLLTDPTALRSTENGFQQQVRAPVQRHLADRLECRRCHHQFGDRLAALEFCSAQ